MKIYSLIACLAFISVAANADAKSDQLKVYNPMGIKIPHPPALCNLTRRVRRHASSPNP